MILYLDVDGVLADFDGYVAKHGIQNRTGHIHRPNSEWSDEDKKVDAEVRLLMDTPGFWSALPVLPDAHELWDYVQKHYTVTILTARPVDAIGAHRIAEEKHRWVNDHFDEGRYEFICCLRSEKREYARSKRFLHSRNLLIDDMPYNCREWTEAGGISIRHTSACDTIKHLKALHDPS